MNPDSYTMGEYFWLQVAAIIVATELLGLRRWLFRKISLLFAPIPSDSLLSAVDQLSASVRKIQKALPKTMGPLSEHEIEAVASQIKWPQSLRIRRAANNVNKSILEDAEIIQIDKFSSHSQFSGESLTVIKKRISKLEEILAQIQRKADRGA